ncbi:hypothetical protein Q7C36_017470 [Tachysurus vachellii]|uniref:Uncharacterized protein n=1 Tax=Tachysurus vachellii TaxID=175792 RepID=A0AA88SD39_TACVA|nr:hypothetical protein Q7C36_017470 [Tachysurus vachellii]
MAKRHMELLCPILTKQIEVVRDELHQEKYGRTDESSVNRTAALQNRSHQDAVDLILPAHPLHHITIHSTSTHLHVMYLESPYNAPTLPQPPPSQFTQLHSSLFDSFSKTEKAPPSYEIGCLQKEPDWFSFNHHSYAQWSEPIDQSGPFKQSQEEAPRGVTLTSFKHTV